MVDRTDGGPVTGICGRQNRGPVTAVDRTNRGPVTGIYSRQD